LEERARADTIRAMTKLIQRMRNRRNENDRWPPGSAGFSLRVSYG
jgi:hypothetical protein